MTAQPNNTVTQLVPKVEHSFVMVDPSTAHRWLDRNDKNRTIRNRKVSEYARAMAEGRWSLSNDDICFAPDGRLLNGQHRLLAVIAADATVLMGVKRNVPPSAMENMDTGSARTAGDYLDWSGEKNPQLLGSTIKLLILHDSGRMYGDAKKQIISRFEYADYLDANPGLRNSVDLASAVYKRTDATPTALAMAHYLIARANGLHAANDYLTRLSSRTGEPEGSPVLAVDSRLREMRKNKTRIENKHLVYLLIKGYNYIARERGVGKLAVAPKSGQNFRIPEVAPIHGVSG